jgi:hypothetical protein
MIPCGVFDIRAEIWGKAIHRENLLLLDVMLNQGEKYAGKA